MARKHHKMTKGVEHYAGRGMIGGNAMRERHSGAMINDDRSAPCNLPQHVMEKYWPVSHNYHMGYVDDLFDGANKQLKEDYNDFGRELGPRKY